MRCVIAGFSFDLVKPEVEAAMRDIKPESIEGESVTIGRRVYPVKQVGEVITRQDRRDFSAKEVVRALTRIGFTCHPAPSTSTAPAPFDPSSPLGY